ncbi:MAG TPA: hypothetical protein VLV17_06955 [Anaeromyxobacteraceae bacterium]|nr:hypothetical protein [Anaeromyxobacteraceae bacterium]
MSRALLAKAEYARGDLDAARAELESARRALTPKVPMVRAVRVLEGVARALGRSASPLPAQEF